MNKRIFLGLISIALLFAISCGPTDAQIVATQTAEAQVAITSAALQAALQQATVDTAIWMTSNASSGGGNSSTGGDSGPATETATPPASGDAADTSSSTAPMISVSQDTNCRKGPAGVYGLLGVFLIGQNTEIKAWDGNGNYYYIVNPDNNQSCWLWSEYATIVGDTSGLPVFTPPPSPTATYTATPTPTPVLLWNGAWTVRFGLSLYIFSADITQTGNTIQGKITTGVGEEQVNGTISNDGKTVSGTLNGSTPFTWNMLSGNLQFTGSFNGAIPGVGISVGDPFCGWRSGSSQPASCGP